MTARQLLVHLYPRAWRDRYADEYLAVMESTPLRLGTLLDVLRGAADAHLGGHASADEGVARRSVAVVLVAWVALCGAGAGFQKVVEDGWQPLQQQYPLLGLSILVTTAAALVATLALSVAGVVLLLVTVRRLRAGDRTVWRTLAVPPLCALGLFALLAGLARIAAGHPAFGPRNAATQVAAAGIAAAVLIAVGSTVSAALRLWHGADLRAGQLRLVSAAGVVASMAMQVVALGIAVWAVTVLAVAPQRFTGDGGLLDTTLWPTVLAVMLVAGTSSAIAARSGARLWRTMINGW